MRPRVIDLFAGCGGLSYGLRDAGFEIVAANEIDQWACDTYRANHEDVYVIQEDIQALPQGFWRHNYRGNIDLLVGGPPCQGFSVSGNRQYGIIAESNSLVTDFLRVTEEVDPAVVMVENVRGFKTGSISRDRKVFDYLVESLSLLGYRVTHETIHAECFGVPSLRSRVFIIGSKMELGRSPFPAPTHGDIGERHPYLTVHDAITDLPPLEAGGGTEEAQGYTSEPQNDFQRIMRKGSRGAFNHAVMKHTSRLVDRFKTIKQGHGSYGIGRHTSGETVTSYKMNNQRLRPDRPSQCVTANFQSSFIHPVQHRNLTAREAARLMTFPDSFVFYGKRTRMSSKFLRKYGRENEDHLSQFNQIGNSVPPQLAKKIGETLLLALNPWESTEATGNHEVSLSGQVKS